jgi:hypothetical protein
MDFSTNRIARSMQSSVVKLSYFCNLHFHWLVHKITRTSPVVGFPKISQAATYQQREATERSDFKQIVISHGRGKKCGIVTMTNGTHPWSPVAQILRTSYPNHDGDRKTFQVMISTL